MRRIALAVLTVLCCIQHALACYGLGLERSMLFDESELNRGVDAPIIVDITVKSITPVDPTNTLIVSAQVHRIVKGTIDGDGEVKIVVVPSSCDRGLLEGARGIVVGEFVRVRMAHP